MFPTHFSRTAAPLLGLATLAALGLAAAPASALGGPPPPPPPPPPVIYDPANLVQDSSFEQSDPGAATGSGRTYAAGTSFDGGLWTVTQGHAAIDTNDQYVYDGGKDLFLTPDSTQDAVSQTLATVAGQQYNISFYANADDVNSFGLLFGGTIVPGGPTTIDQGGYPSGDVRGNAGNFTFYTATATATSDSTVLTLEDTSEFGIIQVDDVSVTAVPEPSQWAVFGLGAFGIGGLIIKARRKQAAQAA